MILISSMGGCGSTSFIDWASRHVDCNCPMNSEGLPNPGSGSNCKGLKHRIRPPWPNDPYLPAGKGIDKSLFLFDSPCQIIPSLFRRKIAVGHAIAITGERPTHGNDLDGFLNAGVDSFGFSEQFNNWCDTRCDPGYPRMLVRASLMWSHLPEIVDFLGITPRLQASFPTRKERQSSFQQLSDRQQVRMKEIYAEIDDRIGLSSDIRII